MKSKQIVLVLIVAVVLMGVASCGTFEDVSSTQDGEITAFGDVYLNGEVTVGDLENLGTVTASRSLTYTLQANGDWVVEMGDYTYSYNAAEDKGTETGTRVVGNLEYASGGAMGSPLALGGGDLVGGLLGGLLPGGGEEEPVAAKIPGPRQIAKDAVNYDLLQEAAGLGSMAILLPTYSWDADETISGTTLNIPLLGPSKTVNTRTVEYTVTARAIAVSF